MAANEDRKAELIRQLGTSRARMSAHSQGAGAHMHPAAKFRSAFSRQRLAWLGGAALLGLILARIPARTKKVVVPRKSGKISKEPTYADFGRAGFAVAVLKLAIDMAKPILIAWATKKMGEVAHVAKKTERKVSRVEAQVR